MRGHSGLLLSVLLLSGCQLPVRLNTSSDVNMSGRIDTKVSGRFDGNIRTEWSPLVDQGPLCESRLPAGTPECPDGAQPPSCGTPKVAVIDIDGVLTDFNHSGPFSVGENPVALFAEKLNKAAADPLVSAVVLRINSPGGGVAASDLMWVELRRFRQRTGKPVVACLLDVGAGGAYLLATACDAIVALPGSTVGGIGVILNVYFANEAMGRVGVYDNSIRAGDKIDMGSPVRNLSPQERKLLEDMARDYHERFKKAVLEARPGVKPGADLFDGRIMTGGQAVQAGLVDQLGDLWDACALAGSRAGAPAPGPQVVMYHRRMGPARSLYATTPNHPIHPDLLPLQAPGLERSKLPLFLYMWQPEPTTLPRLSGM